MGISGYGLINWDSLPTSRIDVSNDKIRQLLDELTTELKTTNLDSDTTLAMQKLDDDIRGLLSSSKEPQQKPSIIEEAKLMEIKIANKHPTAEKLIQEVIDILSKMGI